MYGFAASAVVSCAIYEPSLLSYGKAENGESNGGSASEGSDSSSGNGESPQPSTGEAGESAAGGSAAECSDASDCDDRTVCTDDSCTLGKCFHTANQDPCEDDFDDCTTDVCAGGLCTHPANASCTCAEDSDCNDFNPCTDDSCKGQVCDNAPNSAACAGDLSPCTDDRCDEGACAHPDKGICSGADLVAIRANRSKRYVALNAAFLEHTSVTLSDAEVFEKVEEVNYKLKLRALSNGLFVTLEADDRLVATADQAEATVFSAPPCGTRRGLRAGNDDDAAAWVQASDLAEGGSLSASVGACAADGGSWEQFELIPVGGACNDPLDCDDGNECTNETCSAGFCVFTELTGACTDDLDSCTDDVCDRGACTHPQTGSCPSTTIKIRANGNDKYVVLNASFLQHTGENFAAGEQFEQVMTVGGEFRLRAASTSLFVRVDAAESLIADADFAGAAIFSSPDCGALGALVAESDDDSNNYLKADANEQILASEGWCNAMDDGAWEKFELVLSP